jgi:hypothetical protein
MKQNYYIQPPPNKACTGRVGILRLFKQFPHFEFFLLSNIVHAHPPASNANRSAASSGMKIWAIVFLQEH